MATTIQHPAYFLQRGKPSRASVGTETYELDTDEGTFTVEDDAAAAEAMDRLADTYGVEYYDGGTIKDASVDATPTDETADESGESDGESAADDGEALAQAAADATESEYSREELEAMDMDEVKDVADEVGVDEDSVDMRAKDNVVAAILQEQSDGVATDESDEQ